MKPSTMKAIVCTAYGSPNNLQLQEIPTPVPQANEVLVQVYATTATTADSMMRRADPFISRFFLGFSKPKTAAIGTGFAGVITAIGSDVKAFKVGDEVFGESGMKFSANAEYLTVGEDQIICHKPTNVSFADAATVTDGPLTSLNFLTNVYQLKPGQRILINGASGSLGTAAVQLAKLLGAEVTAVCSAKNSGLVRSLGADFVIDYHQVDFTQTGETYDVIYDTVGKRSFPECKPALKAKGAYISPVLNLKLLAQMLITGITKGKVAKFDATGMQAPKVLRPMLQQLADMLEDQELKVIIDRRYPLAETAAAHSYVDTGHKRGNVVIEVKSETANTAALDQAQFTHQG